MTTHTSTATVQLRADRVKLLRQMRELDTDYRLSAAMGISQSNVSRVLNGKQQPGGRFIAALCVALGATMNDLFEVTDGQAAA